jgi:hypothetical protein
LLTSNAAKEVAEFFTSLVVPHALVMANEQWAPRGLLEPAEAKLGETRGFLAKARQDALTRWWLARPGRANTPNWDLMSTCRVRDQRGLILVEAKAHEAEFSNEGCGATDKKNSRQIQKAIDEAMTGWNSLLPGFALSAGSHYQLSNRFAFAWKLANMGVPVVLVYLGFLDAHDMAESNRVLLRDYSQWHRCVLTRSKGVIPEGVWETTFSVDGTPLTVLLRSAIVGIGARREGNGLNGDR